MSASEDTVSTWERLEWLFPSVWLVFLVYPVATTLASDAPTWAVVTTLACLAGFAVVYVLGFGVWDDHPWACFGTLLLLAAACVPLLGMEIVSLAPFLGAFSALSVPRPWWPWTTVAVAMLPVLGWVEGSFPLFYFLIVWPVVTVCALIRLLMETDAVRRSTREELAVVAERERVARDVHDVLGHSLTVLSVKAELAARLVETDPARARTELESIQETARRALAEVRETVGGLRAANLAAELEAAPRVLADAGVEVTVAGGVDDTDPRHRALLAWVLREAVTNVVRHAGARTVEVRLHPSGVVVRDDGVGCRGPEGNGLRGMRERVQKAGGTLTVVDAGPGTELEVVLP